MNKFVIDASVLLAYIRKENCLEDLSLILPYSIMSTVNYAEVIAVLSDHSMPQEVIDLTIPTMIYEIVPFDSAQANITGQLREKSKAKGLSLGDRACLALGQMMQLPVYTADRIWSQVKIEGVEVRLIR